MLGNKPAQFGKGRMKKGQQWYLVSRLLHLEGGKGRKALPIPTSVFCTRESNEGRSHASSTSEIQLVAHPVGIRSLLIVKALA